MLRKNLFAAYALVVLILATGACSDPSAGQFEDRPEVIDFLRVELPFDDDDAEFENAPALEINASAEFELKSQALSPEEMSSYLAEQRAGGSTYLSVKVDEDATVGGVIALLSPIAENTAVYVAQTTGGSFRREQIKRTDPIRKRLYVGRIGTYDLPLIAGYLSQEDQCVLLLGGGGASILKGRPLDISELDQVATKFLNRYVEHHGGSDIVAGKPEVVSTLVARIQAQAETPWRCVAAPIERVNGIGWPVLQYEVVP